ncbi:hypothetical protein ACLB2K_067612 [Fragaria x ananassa]
MEAAAELEEASLRGQADVWKYMLGFADSMALRSAVELRIPDIIHSWSCIDVVRNSLVLRLCITLSRYLMPRSHHAVAGPPEHLHRTP